jgi:putative ABC transport system permease protein
MWFQLGTLSSALASTAFVPGRLSGDLLLVSETTESMTTLVSVPRREMIRAGAHPDVEWVRPFYSGNTQWKVPFDDQSRKVSVYGIDPDRPSLKLAGIEEHASALREKDVCLFDEQSRRDFAPVVARLRRGEIVEAEAGGRKQRVIGMTSIGVTLGVDATILVSEENFQRLSSAKPMGAIGVGVIRLRPGADLEAVRRDLTALHGPEYRVMTPVEFQNLELSYQMRRTPITFIFGLGTAVGFAVGFGIVYQILYTDVTNHLPQFATLKAMGYDDAYLRRIVFGEGMLLSLFGFPIGTFLAGLLFALLRYVTGMPAKLTWTFGVIIFLLTLLMCALSGLLAVRKLAHASPADVF